jgi:ubiquinone/menaquinone biosynthesis C-methylase UbiE
MLAANDAVKSSSRCGSGYFTFRLAQHAGEKGRVYAVDVSPDMIVHLNRRVRDLKSKNIVTILAAWTIPC